MRKPKLIYFEDTALQILAHRGVSAHHHENTLKAFDEALKLNIYGIELDVHQVEDNFIIFHDFTLEKITGTPTEIAKMSAADLAQIRFNYGQQIPSLAEVLTLINGRMPVNLEIKAMTNFKLFVDKLVQYVYNTNGLIILSSFNHLVIKELQALIRETRIENNIKYGALIAHLPVTYADYAVNLEADIAAIDAFLVTKNFVEHAHTHNKEVWCYTVNGVSHAKHLKQMGVDGIFTNDPELMLKHLKD